MSLARRLRRGRPGGVVVCGHTLTAVQARFQVEVLGRWFEFIHHDDLIARLERPRSRPFCLLTYDDGKRSNATALAPELHRLGVPAAFYVVTRYLSEGKPLWFDRQIALERALGGVPRELTQPELKKLRLSAIEQRLDEACARYGVTADLSSDDVRPMSWEDARTMSRQGFTIGAHSRRHAILPNEPETDALSDIRESIAEVSAQLGTPCRSFAFPNGNFTPRLALQALETGVTTVMTTLPVWADGRHQPWRVPRVQLFGRQSRLEIELKLAAAATGRILVNPDGTRRDYVGKPIA
jgi:peptidoglycan/xylan/chitin deacetylase (PgdA/CDA1 family)